MGTELATIEERIKRELAIQQEQAAAVKSGGNFISFKNGNMKVNGQPVPSNSADVRVLAVVAERAWYDGAYDPDTPQTPACYALGTAGVPHPEARDPQSDTCANCAHNKWGTAPPRPGSTKPGRGKACREGARVVVTPSSLILEQAPLYQAKVPVTSLGYIDAFTSRANQAGKLYGEFITTMNVAEDKKSFFKVFFTIKELSSSPEMLGTVLKRQEEALELAMQPFPDFDEEEEEQPKSKSKK